MEKHSSFKAIPGLTGNTPITVQAETGCGLTAGCFLESPQWSLELDGVPEMQSCGPDVSQTWQ